MASASPAASGGIPPTDAFDVNALIAAVLANKLAVVVLAPSIAVFFWFFVSYQTSPLKKYPGPFLAGKSWPPHPWLVGHGSWVVCDPVLTLPQDGPTSGACGRSSRASMPRG